MGNQVPVSDPGNLDSSGHLQKPNALDLHPHLRLPDSMFSLPHSRRNATSLLGFLLAACAPSRVDTSDTSPENVESAPIYIDYEVANQEGVREGALNDPAADIVVELIDFGKTQFGELEEQYDTSVVEQNGLRVALDRDTNIIAFTGEEFTASFDLNNWIGSIYPTYGEGWCVSDPEVICSEQASYLLASDTRVVSPFVGGEVVVQLLLVQGPWAVTTQTFEFGRVFAVVGVYREG